MRSKPSYEQLLGPINLEAAFWGLYLRPPFLETPIVRMYRPERGSCMSCSQGRAVFFWERSTLNMVQPSAHE